MSLSVFAIGTGQLKYQWKKDGQNVTDSECIGPDTSNLGITSFSDAHVGWYTCVIKDSQMSVESYPARLDLGNWLLATCSVFFFLLL